MPDDDVILAMLKGLDDKCQVRFDGIDKRLDDGNDHVKSLTVGVAEMKQRHEIEDARSHGDVERHKATRSSIRFWVLIVGVPIALAQLAVQRPWEVLP